MTNASALGAVGAVIDNHETRIAAIEVKLGLTGTPSPAPAPSPTPAPTPAPAPSGPLWCISSAPNCTTGAAFHLGAAAMWENQGGDWWDATGAKQGTVPYASFASPAGTTPQTWTFDVTKLLADLGAMPIEMIVNGTGRYIDGVGGATPPSLAVTYADGTTATLACVVAIALDTTTYLPVAGTTLAIGAGGGGGVALRFASPASLPTKAVVLLSSETQWGGAAEVIKIMRLRQPAIPTTVQYGLAKAGLLSQCILNMTLDANPLSDFLIEPTTLDFTSLASYDLTFQDVTKFPAICMAERKFVGDNLKTHSVVTLASGHKAIKFDCVGPTEANPNGGTGQELVADWIFMFTPDATGKLPQEMYVQWKMTLDPNFVIPVGSQHNGGKWGFGFSHRTTGCGNGGAFCHSPAADAGKQGWTARGQHIEPSNPADPAFGTMLVGTYDYNAVESQIAHMFGLRAALVPGREYLMEKYIKMNTNDMTGATPAKNDGIIRFWLDGVLVFEKTDYKFRDNPPWVNVTGGVPVLADAAIRDVWLNSWWGGLWDADMHNTHYVRDVRIAAAYIGPDA